MTRAESEKVGRAFEVLVGSFCHGLFRLWQARAGQLTLALALLRFRSHNESYDGGPYEDVLKELGSVAYGEYDAFAYVANVSQLVHATALFDTFLTECTRFLYMLHPGSMGKDHGVRVDDLLAATSKDDLITKAATRKAREEAYGSFSDRLASLAKRYGLRLGLDAETEGQIAHYAGVRNAVVHDQAVLISGSMIPGASAYERRHALFTPRPLRTPM